MAHYLAITATYMIINISKFATYTWKKIQDMAH